LGLKRKRWKNGDFNGGEGNTRKKRTLETRGGNYRRKGKKRASLMLGEGKKGKISIAQEENADTSVSGGGSAGG